MIFVINDDSFSSIAVTINVSAIDIPIRNTML